MVYSQGLAAFITDAILYLITWLLTQHLPSIWPLLLTFIMQLLIAALWSYCAHQWYFHTFQPLPTAIIYDQRRGMEDLINEYVKDAYLHIYGDGDYAEELKKGTDDRIIYHGIVPNEEVVNAEIHSTLLINPRPSKEEFTKYSFPSKNMEYMASGTPVLTTDLPGMPKEYKPYIYVFEDETVEGMASTLQTVLSLTKQELHQMGMQAKSYVLANKTNQAQAKRILSELF